MKSMRSISVATFATALLPALAPASQAARVTLEPSGWDYGTRPEAHLITKTVHFHPPEGRRVRISRIQITCRCLKAEVLRGEGTADSPAEVRVVMDTDGLKGHTKHMILFVLTAPRKTVVRFEVTGWVLPAESPGCAEVFYSAGEASGKRFLDWWRSLALPGAAADRVKLLPIDVIENYNQLRELEHKAEVRLPSKEIVAFIDEVVVLNGEKEVKAGLAGLLNLESDGRPKPRPAETKPLRGQPGEAQRRPEAPKRRVRPQAARAEALEVWLFYYSDCRGCEEALAVVRGIERERIGEVRLKVLDTARDPESIPLVFAMAEMYPEAPKVLPSMIAFVGDELLLGVDDVTTRAASLVERQLARGGEHLRVRRPGEVVPVTERTGLVRLVPVVLAGLADGVNPCAFAAMVLLVSILTTAHGRGRRSLLLGGSAFCVGVFFTYYLAGFALFAGARRLEGFPVAEAVVFWVVCGLAVACGVFSAADAVVYLRTGDTGRVRLKVPEVLKRRFAPILRGRVRSYGLVIGGLVGGVLVAILEGICTGQMYLPTIQYMARTPGLRTRGAAYLLVYNVLFVAPLVLILVVALAGVHFRRLNEFLRRHLGSAKLLLAAVFFLLATAMLLGRFHIGARWP